jgi:hypothetical protein
VHINWELALYRSKRCLMSRGTGVESIALFMSATASSDRTKYVGTCQEGTHMAQIKKDTLGRGDGSEFMVW